MMQTPNPWTLPGLSAWLEEVMDRLDHGISALRPDGSRPHGVVEALIDRIGNRCGSMSVVASAGSAPAMVLAEAYGTAPTLEALLNPALEQELAVITLASPGPEDLREWAIFLRRYLADRAGGRPGPALFLPDAPHELDLPEEATPQEWRRALRRGDLVIWAEAWLPSARSGAAAELSVALAAQLCGWRLDLASALVRAGLDDLADPLAWLESRPEAAMPGHHPPCPLGELRAGRPDTLVRHIWRAQLGVLFPLIEETRLSIVENHRRNLRLDDHLRGLGVASVDEIELGALHRQLSAVMTRPDADRLAAMARARNRLAHRRPADPADVRRLVRFWDQP